MTRIAHPLSRLRRTIVPVGVVLAGLAAMPSTGAFAHGSRPEQAKPTVVLVHGAWADSSSWNSVIKMLQDDGYPVAAPPDPLRSLSADSAYLRTYLDTLSGPIVLVGHSYGAAVITEAATGRPDVKALVYVDGLVPDEGQTLMPLAGPDSALAVDDPTTIFDFVPGTLPPTATSDVYLKASTFQTAFANGLHPGEARVLAASQRPIALGALNEPSGVPAWQTIQSWFLVGTQDRVVPPSAQRAMAHTAGAKISEFRAGHLGLISDPKPVMKVIEQAARATS